MVYLWVQWNFAITKYKDYGSFLKHTLIININIVWRCCWTGETRDNFIYQIYHFLNYLLIGRPAVSTKHRKCCSCPPNTGSRHQRQQTAPEQHHNSTLIALQRPMHLVGRKLFVVDSTTTAGFSCVWAASNLPDHIVTKTSPPPSCCVGADGCQVGVVALGVIVPPGFEPQRGGGGSRGEQFLYPLRPTCSSKPGVSDGRRRDCHWYWKKSCRQSHLQQVRSCLASCTGSHTNVQLHPQPDQLLTNTGVSNNKEKLRLC